MFRRIGGAGRVGVVCLQLVWLGIPSLVAAGSAAGQTTVAVSKIADGEVAAAVERAARGARRRLAEPECQAILDEFRDAGQRTLREVSAALAAAPYAALDRAIFRDGVEATICRSGTAAFTGAGSRVVFVCGQRFLGLARDVAELVIIHEMLHTLGLGERPPTSRQIDQAVARRCGR